MDAKEGFRPTPPIMLCRVGGKGIRWEKERKEGRTGVPVYKKGETSMPSLIYAVIVPPPKA